MAIDRGLPILGRHELTAERDGEAEATRWRRAGRAILDFALAPASPVPLAVFRIGIAAILLAQALLLSSQAFRLFGSSGILQGALAELTSVPGIPRLGMVSAFAARFGISEHACLAALGLAYTASLTWLMLGWRARAAALAAWLTHMTLMMSGSTTNYGVDQFTHIALFYLIWMPAGHALSLDAASGRVSGEPHWSAGLSLRVLQLHLCIVYLASGVEKALGDQWWSGEAIWRSLMLPVYNQYDFAWLARLPWLARLAGLGTLVVELGYPVFIWPKRTRLFWVALTLSLHAGIAVFLGLGLFAAVMMLLTFSAFALTDERVTGALSSRRSREKRDRREGSIPCFSEW